MLKPSLFEKKQNKIVLLLVAAGLILIWQLYELFAGDNKTEQTAVKPVMTPNVAAKQLAQKATVANESGAAVDPTESQTEYLRLVNEYQMAQLQRMIAESNEAIAVAKQNAVKATLETQKLMGSNAVTTSSDGAQANVKGYQLVYTGQQADGQWAATLKKNSQSIDVIVGKQLADGSQVISIDDNGVLLSKGADKILVTFTGETISGSKQPIVEPQQPVAVAKSVEPVKSVATLTVNKSVISSAHADTVVNNPTTSTTPAKPKAAEEIAKTTKAITDAKAAANAPLPEINVGVINKSADKTHTPNSFEEHMVSFPVIPQQPSKEAAKPAVAEVKATPAPALVATPAPKPTLPTSVVPAMSTTKQPTTVQPAATPAPQPLPAMQEANQQLLTADSAHYTIQLTSDHSVDDVQFFAEDNGLKDKATYFRTKDKQGKDLFVLIYGDYANFADAQAALEKLPEDARGEGAFVIKMSSIQTLLKK